MDYRVETWWGSTLCVWAALFREATAHPRTREGPRKGGSNKAHSHQTHQSAAAGELSIISSKNLKQKQNLTITSWNIQTSTGQRNFLSPSEMHCTCWSCAQRLQCGHCSSLGVKVFWRRCTSWRGRSIHILLVWQALRSMMGIWSIPGYQELPHSKAADSACCHK